MLSQKTLLEAKDSRQILDQVKDDSSSLICLRDADSFVSLSTESTGRSSLLSRIFAFDSELMGSNVYQKQTRLLMTKAVRTPKRAPKLTLDERQKSARRSAQIERMLRQDKKRQHREVRILVRGSNQGKLSLMVRLMHFYREKSYEKEKEECLARLEPLQRRIVSSLLSFVQSSSSLPESPESLDHMQMLQEVYRTGGYPLGSTAMLAIQSLWQNSAFQRQHRRTKTTLRDEADRLYVSAEHTNL